jgi:lipopolysaccharide transport system ATP-binding protein
MFPRSLKRSLWYGVQDVLGDITGKNGGNKVLRQDEFWAVKDLSFAVKRGECLGLIGTNGAGKSTILKMLNGLLKPDIGEITMRGRIGALIELGAGFNPVLTGRENIYINGTVLGLTKREIDRCLDTIIAFAELAKFIDSPVSMYSSGMKVRLGFAIASHVEADILLIDEVLAVGDAAFRSRCINRISQLARQSAIIFVSHAMPLVGRVANRAILMGNGRQVLQEDNVVLNIQEYLRQNREVKKFISGGDTVELLSLNVVSSEARLDNDNIQIRQFADFKIVLTLAIRKKINQSMVNIAFFDQEEKNVAETFSVNSQFLLSGDREQEKITVHFEKFSLNTGKFYMQLGIIEYLPGGGRGEIYYVNKGGLSFEIIGQMHGYAPVQLNPAWSAL